MPHLTQDMSCSTLAGTNGNTLLANPEEGEDSVGFFFFLKKLFLYTNISFRYRRLILCHLQPSV